MFCHVRRTHFLAVALFASLTAASLAGPGKGTGMDPTGEPEGLKKSDTECFKVWHNQEGWHLRVINTRGNRDRRFQGTITVENGTIEITSSQLARRNDAQWKPGAKKNSLTFDFTTKDREDGINFTTSKGATAVKFTLKIDGQEVPQQIFIGRRGAHPDASTFALDAHPGDNQKPDKVSGTQRKTGIK